jgi:hypothetical protein
VKIAAESETEPRSTAESAREERSWAWLAAACVAWAGLHVEQQHRERPCTFDYKNLAHGDDIVCDDFLT